jgi:NAD(P)-dependent dehydrogenase (short-subunit alcohol dehydrogenase family)
MSNAFNPDGSKFADVKDKVVVLTGRLCNMVAHQELGSRVHDTQGTITLLANLDTGGANGIGACTVRLLRENGAKVVFGDYDVTAGEAIASELGDDVTFLKVNVAEYSDNLALFKLAREKYGHVDHAVAVAGVGERGDWYGEGLSVEDVESPPQNTTIDINLVGVLYFVRVALPYLRLERNDSEDKSVVIVGSAAGFRESPGLPVYNATKHGVQGVMRSLRKSLYSSQKIRINVLCPGVVDTNMAHVVAKAFRSAGLEDAVNVPENLAVTILGFLTETSMWGKSVYVEGGKGWEFEDGYWDTMPQWLGEGPTQRLRKGLELVASVSVAVALLRDYANLCTQGNIWNFHHTQEAPSEDKTVH